MPGGYIVARGWSVSVGKEIKRRELWTQEPFLISTFWFLGFNLQFTALGTPSIPTSTLTGSLPSWSSFIDIYVREEILERETVCGSGG